MTKKLTNTESKHEAPMQTRRQLLQKASLAGLGIGAFAVTGLTTPRVQADSHISMLEESSPQAQALGYKHDASAVDGAKYPQSQGGNKVCANCRLYSAATKEGWGACPIFAGKLVRGAGWCSAWVPVEA